MRSYLNFLYVFLAAAALLPAQNTDDAVRSAERRWAEATIKADVVTLEKVLATDLTYTHSSARMETKAEFIEAVRSGTIKYKSIEYGEMWVRRIGRAAILTSEVKVSLESGGQQRNMRLRILHVWVQGDAGWQLAAHQSTRFPD
jgi:ketosteroid isomerase-like protein